MSEHTTESADFVSLYRQAFTEFGASALCSSKPVPDPTPADALAITYSLPRFRPAFIGRWKRLMSLSF